MNPWDDRSVVWFARFKGPDVDASEEILVNPAAVATVEFAYVDDPGGRVYELFLVSGHSVNVYADSLDHLHLKLRRPGGYNPFAPTLSFPSAEPTGTGSPGPGTPPSATPPS